VNVQTCKIEQRLEMTAIFKVGIAAQWRLNYTATKTASILGLPDWLFMKKGVAYSWVEIDPFAENVPASYLATHPFKRVPALVHGAFVAYETGAITRYVDEAFDGPKLQRTEPTERARRNQIMSIVDSYAYWPLVRQVFSHSVFRPRMRRPVDAKEIRRGLDAAARVFAALEKLAGEGQYLCGSELSLADIHLAPMIGYFVLASE